MFHFGFSYVGLLYLVMLMLPNMIWTRHKPEDYEKYVGNENKLLLVLERGGEALVTVTALVFSDFNLRKWTAWCWWLVASFLLMLLYEVFWIRYFMSKKTMRDFYRGLLFFPVAGASHPVAAFFLLGIYGGNGFLLVFALILGIGHIGIHLQHKKEVEGPAKKKPVKRILSVILAAVGILIAGTLMTVTLIRNIRYLPHVGNAVDEAEYISIGGQDQYVLFMGKKADNPVILYLHGGPSSPDAFVTYAFADHLTDEYTFVAWDQRGCGRTYYQNADTDPENSTVDFERALGDLDELVDYVRWRFGQDKVILMGHSYGTILGSRYAGLHPDKVSAYIGVAQMTSLEKTDIYSYENALALAGSEGKDTSEMKKAYETFMQDRKLSSKMALRRLTDPYHPVEYPANLISLSVCSPYFGVDDFRWFLKQLGDIDDYRELNRRLFDYTDAFDVYEEGMNYEMPAYFISGSDDWVCPADTVNAYVEQLSAPDKSFTVIKGCGHNVQYTKPREFADIVKKLIAGN